MVDLCHVTFVALLDDAVVGNDLADHRWPFKSQVCPFPDVKPRGNRENSSRPSTYHVSTLVQGAPRRFSTVQSVETRLIRGT